MVNKIRYYTAAYTADTNNTAPGVPAWSNIGCDCLAANVGLEAATGEPAGPSGATTATPAGGK